MCYWVLPASGMPTADTSVQYITHADVANPDIAEQIETFNEQLTNCLNDENFQIADPTADGWLQDVYNVPVPEDPTACEEGSKTPSDQEHGNMLSKPDVVDIPFIDQYIGAQIVLD